jgi:hypothetical protein
MCPLRAVLAALAASAALTACGEPCARLSEALCDGGDPAYCQDVDGWLQQRLVDPATKEPLAGEARDQMCGTIYKSVDVFNAYRFKAKQKLRGEPDFTLASSTPAANKADPTPMPPPAEVKAAPPTPPVIDPKEEVKDELKPAPAGANMND